MWENTSNPPADYDVPKEYLDDETFAAILGEAEKYLGYPYAVSYTHLDVYKRQV